MRCSHDQLPSVGLHFCAFYVFSIRRDVAHIVLVRDSALLEAYRAVIVDSYYWIRSIIGIRSILGPLFDLDHNQFAGSASVRKPL